MKVHLILLSIIIGILSGCSCDPEGAKECDWILEPEPSNIDNVDPGFIPVCARNRKTMKQDCRLQTTLEYAKSVADKKFRLVDLKVESPGIPRTIEHIEFCK